VTAQAQLAAIASLDDLLAGEGIEYWLFGGWAVDFHAGWITRRHEDVDIAVWAKDLGRIAPLLEGSGWRHTSDAGEDGYTVFERDGVRLEVAFLDRGDDGDIFTPLRGGGRGEWPDGAFGDDLARLGGTRARLASLDALKADKSVARTDPAVSAKDAADVATLARFGV
jgi:Aminoglycoside-2''-adenylyltransferase